MCKYLSYVFACIELINPVLWHSQVLFCVISDVNVEGYFELCWHFTLYARFTLLIMASQRSIETFKLISTYPTGETWLYSLLLNEGPSFVPFFLVDEFYLDWTLKVPYIFIVLFLDFLKFKMHARHKLFCALL